MTESDKFWNELIAHIRDRVLVPVTGPELNVVNVDGTSRTLTEVIAGRLNDTYDLELPPTQMRMGTAAAAFVRKRGRDEAEDLYSEISDIIDEFDEFECPPLLDLAKIEPIRLFVSMTPDRLLANAVNDVRFAGRNCTREIAYSPNQSTRDHARNMQEPAESDVCVVKLFGEAASTPQYVIHDEDIVEWIYSLLSGSGRLPDWVTYPLRTQPLLFIGCEVPDWLGRFLLRLSSQTRLWLERKKFYLVNSPDAKEPLLSDFFTTYCRRAQVQHLEMKPADFVAELRTRWEDRSSPPKQRSGTSTAPSTAPTDEPKIFISYMREDLECARRLREEIIKIGWETGEIWLDEQFVRPGDRWGNEIHQSIQTVRLFLAMVSANTEAVDEGYAIREWREAEERSRSMLNRRFIIPVIVDGKPRQISEYRQILEEFRSLDFGHAPGGVPAAELRALLIEELRKWRRGDAG